MQNQGKFLPITWEKHDGKGEYGYIEFYNVTFTDDFGPWKKDQKVDCLFLAVIEGKLQEYDTKNNLKTSFDIKIVPAYQ